ncbi:hypothetical protein RB614_00860 [Phytohabitans sp. ZYX-F-186]|uniref:DUF4760 domain-containing protein n=1 Tax=Phytohabitans maris TaxID=3071409 RepID=A0ABU0Z7N7_9ACTN|nr:hypothetical protein [Phytohabitans sp. ZYX-F-186]MDQ7903070.1 hypothetical protein [Phytohabitans sp. ZYX-F-186]
MAQRLLSGRERSRVVLADRDRPLGFPAVEATAIIAVAGLVTTTACALGVPFIQGRLAAQRERAMRLRDERLVVYTDAMFYMRAIQGRLDETVEDPDLQRSYTWPETPHQDLTTARLHLIAPEEVMRRWDELIHAWEVMTWNMEQDGPVNERGQYHASEDQADVKRVRRAIEGLTVALREAAGAEARASQPLR